MLSLLLLLPHPLQDKTNVAEAFERLINEIYKQVNAPHAPEEGAEEAVRPKPGMVITAPKEDANAPKKEDDCKC